MEPTELLRKSGFSEKETAVYLALTAMGPSVVSDIAERAGINRTTAYIVLDVLMKRELISADEKRGVKLFTPAEPEHLVLYLKKASEHFHKLANQAQKLIPSLKKMAKSHAVPETDSSFSAALTSLEKIRTEAPLKSTQPAKGKAIKRKLAHGTT